ncbi:hypothetical protein BKE38_26060 [Pseudoroseomonas deserti]|uniref:Uncharacterized protein n=1 Tax=Teichococcus deserti TaxID=1817963 RepID=A0A1V2GXA6_9PROT|nr:hypothetical protein [Pseudoroseomonas deserti]ONG45822.1 hypothetical protein BKE38_26060 [Pseudoroseomonas deserti]
MPRLTPERAKTMLARLRALAAAARAGSAWEGRFVEEAVARLVRYGDKAIFTPKQWIQFEQIFRRYEELPEDGAPKGAQDSPAAGT